MTTTKPNRIAVLLNDAFADGETGFLTASARDFFGAEVFHFSPDGKHVVSEGALRVVPSGSFNDPDPADFAALVVCGSSKWAAPGAIDLSGLLREAEHAGTPIGTICAGTLTAARAGLFDVRRHTSNNGSWLKEQVPSYRGESLYQHVNDAVSDRGVVSAPGSAPASFARAMLGLVYPTHPALAPACEMLANAR